MALRFPDGLDESSSNLGWADWVELSLAYTDYDTISRTDLQELLELYFSEEEVDARIEDAFAEIRSRQALMPDTYPLRQRGTHVEKLRPRQDAACFTFLLAVSAHRFYPETTLKDAQWHAPAILFEHVVAAAIQRYVNGSAVRIGTPREYPLPGDFGECLRFLAQHTREESLSPVNPDVGTGDENCDVIGWVPFTDGRPSQLLILAQCGIGKHWDDKLDELSLDVWEQQMKWHVRPTKAFAFPFRLEIDPEDWAYKSRRGGILFDRIRLSELARDDALENPVRQRLLDWCDGFAARLPLAD